MPVVKTYSKGQVVLPKHMRDELGIKPGNMVSVELVDDRIEIRPLPDDPIDFLTGLFKDCKPSMSEKLLEERKKDNEIDDPGSI